MTDEQRAFILSHVDLDRLRERYQSLPIRPLLLVEIQAVANSDLARRWEEIETGWLRRWPDPPELGSVGAVVNQPTPHDIEIGLHEEAFVKLRFEAGS